MLIRVTLPDGDSVEFSSPIFITDIIKKLNVPISNIAIAAKVNKKLVDLTYYVEMDADISIITIYDEEGLHIIRHSVAHLLAQAVKKKNPNIQYTIGPVIEDGFYYDFYSPETISEHDLKAIEEEMENIAKSNLVIKREIISRKEAINLFKKLGELYKVKIIEENISPDEAVSIYRQGDFVDLCKGPHVPNTSFLKAFKLTKISGAYWKGDAQNELLQRIYGTAWQDKIALDDYLHRIAEAEKRDHRVLGKQMALFHLQDEAPGMVFWHEKGWIIYLTIMEYMRGMLAKHGYKEVHTPQILDRRLWELSGHWDNYQEVMFITEIEKRLQAIKPMNCPGHIQIFNQGIKSYRDLPIRLAEFGSCHRKEYSGTLHGLMRVRNFVQDDAHIFCTEEHIQEEVTNFILLLKQIYSDFGFKDVSFKLSTRPSNRVGSDDLWDKAEKALEFALNSNNLAWKLAPGDGAFYGPKIDFDLKDCLNRVWQCGTIQVDFSMPNRLSAMYVDNDGYKKPVVMLHRAILGSIERFIGILVENYGGHLPLWLAPVQAVVLNITDSQKEYAKDIVQNFTQSGLRVKVDLRNEKISFKIREHTLSKVPFILIVGDREKESGQVSVRACDGKDLGVMKIGDICQKLINLKDSKSIINDISGDS